MTERAFKGRLIEYSRGKNWSGNLRLALGKIKKKEFTSKFYKVLHAFVLTQTQTYAGINTNHVELVA